MHPKIALSRTALALGALLILTGCPQPGDVRDASDRVTNAGLNAHCKLSAETRAASRERREGNEDEPLADGTCLVCPGDNPVRNGKFVCPGEQP